MRSAHFWYCSQSVKFNSEKLEGQSMITFLSFYNHKDMAALVYELTALLLFETDP